MRWITRVLFAVFFFSALTGCNRTSHDERSITDSDCVLAIYTQSLGLRLGEEEDVKVIVVAWSDGTIVWSSDSVRGGGPYRIGHIKPERISGVLLQLSDRGAFDISQLTEANMGPDSTFATILARYQGRELKMESWHEYQEIDGKGVARNTGSEPLYGTKLWSALETEPAEYLHYRMCWLEIKLAAFLLLPASGEITEATFFEKNRKVYCKLQGNGIIANDPVKNPNSDK